MFPGRAIRALFAGLSISPLFALAAESLSFENTNIVRTIELGGSNVHVTTTYTVRALQEGAKTYTIAIGEHDYEKNSWLEVKIKGQSEPLEYQRAGLGPASHSYLYNVVLPKALAVDESTNLIVETVQTNAAYPWPDAATQSEDQALKYHADLFVVSPYTTISQRTKLRSPSPRILSYTEPTGVEAYTKDSSVTKSGATITYGPFSNIPPSSTDDFTQQQRIAVHYHLDEPMLQVLTLKRAAEISHWGANLNIQDEINLHNAGPKLKGQFSRLEHQMQALSWHQPSPQVLKKFAVHLPPGINNVYFYDLNGNVSTSHLRVAPSPPKYSNAPAKFSVLEVQPRYPLMGGWNYSFTLGWDTPLENSVGYDAKSDRYVAAIPVMTHIPGSSVNEAEISIVLPEGATDIELFQPFPALSITRFTHVTYLDTVGRPAVTFKYRQLTEKHTGSIYVTYKVPVSAHYKKPVAVATAFMVLFGLALTARRVDGRIQKH